MALREMGGWHVRAHARMEGWMRWERQGVLWQGRRNAIVVIGVAGEGGAGGWGRGGRAWRGEEEEDG